MSSKECTKLLSPFHSPITSCGETFVQPDTGNSEPNKTETGPNSVMHVSLPQVELNSTLEALKSTDDADPTSGPCVPPSLNSAEDAEMDSKKLDFTIDESGHAALKSVNDPVWAPAPHSSVGSSSKGAPNLDWELDPRVLGLSSSPFPHEPTRTASAETPGLRAPLFKAPAGSGQPIFGQPGFGQPGQPIGQPGQLGIGEPGLGMKRTYAQLSSSPSRHNDEFFKMLRVETPTEADAQEGDETIEIDNPYEEAATSDIISDVSRPIVIDPERPKVVLRSADQVTEVVRRSIHRVLVDAQLRAIEERGPFTGLPTHHPLFRPEGLKTIHGKPSRVQALQSCANAPSIRAAVRGKLRCSRDCGAQFTSYIAFANHLDKVHGLNERPYECPVRNCPWSVLGFIMATDCGRHIKSAHSESHLLCELCAMRDIEKRFARTDALRRHLVSAHCPRKTDEQRDENANK